MQPLPEPLHTRVLPGRLAPEGGHASRVEAHLLDSRRSGVVALGRVTNGAGVVDSYPMWRHDGPLVAEVRRRDARAH